MNKFRKSLVVKAPASSKKAKTIKSLPAQDALSTFAPLPLSSVYGKSEEEISRVIKEWKLEANAALHLALEQRRNPQLERVKQLLDWYVEGYSIQVDNIDQLVLIKDMLARNYQPGPDGTWKFSHPLSLPLD